MKEFTEKERKILTGYIHTLSSKEKAALSLQQDPIITTEEAAHLMGIEVVRLKQINKIISDFIRDPLSILI